MVSLSKVIVMMIVLSLSLNAFNNKKYDINGLYLGQKTEDVEKIIKSEFKKVKFIKEVVNFYNGKKYEKIVMGKKIEGYRGKKYYRIYIDSKDFVYFISKDYYFSTEPVTDILIKQLKDKYGKPVEEQDYNGIFFLCYGSCDTKKNDLGSSLKIKYRYGSMYFELYNRTMYKENQERIYKLQEESDRLLKIEKNTNSKKASVLDL